MIIIIDGNISRALANQSILNYYGIGNVILTHDSYSGIRLCASSHRDLDFIFINLFMTDLEGFEILHHIKHVSKKIPVFACSALNDAKLIKKCQQEGFSGFIHNPLTFIKASEFLKQVPAKSRGRKFICISG